MNLLELSGWTIVGAFIMRAMWSMVVRPPPRHRKDSDG